MNIGFIMIDHFVERPTICERVLRIIRLRIYGESLKCILYPQVG